MVSLAFFQIGGLKGGCHNIVFTRCKQFPLLCVYLVLGGGGGGGGGGGERIVFCIGATDKRFLNNCIGALNRP